MADPVPHAGETRWHLGRPCASLWVMGERGRHLPSHRAVADQGRRSGVAGRRQGRPRQRLPRPLRRADAAAAEARRAPSREDRRGACGPGHRIGLVRRTAGAPERRHGAEGGQLRVSRRPRRRHAHGPRGQRRASARRAPRRARGPNTAEDRKAGRPPLHLPRSSRSRRHQQPRRAPAPPRSDQPQSSPAQTRPKPEPGRRRCLPRLRQPVSRPGSRSSTTSPDRWQ